MIVIKRPLGITLIGYFYIFGSIVLLLTLGVQQDIGMNIRFGVPYLPETLLRIFVSLLSIIMAYGYLKLKKWGYWTMLIYSLIFLLTSINQGRIYHSQPFIGNATFSMIVIIYTTMKVHYFCHEANL